MVEADELAHAKMACRAHRAHPGAAADFDQPRTRQDVVQAKKLVPANLEGQPAMALLGGPLWKRMRHVHRQHIALDRLRTSGTVRVHARERLLVTICQCHQKAPGSGNRSTNDSLLQDRRQPCGTSTV